MATKGEQGEKGVKGNQGNQGARGQQGDRGPSVKLSTLVLVVVLPLFAYLYTNSVSSVDNLRSSCDRGNTLRQVEYDFLQSAVKARQESAAAAPKGSVTYKINHQAALDYKGLTQQLVAAVSDAPLEPGSPEVNCDEAFPRPWPLN